MLLYSGGKWVMPFFTVGCRKNVIEICDGKHDERQEMSSYWVYVHFIDQIFCSQRLKMKLKYQD